MDSTVDNPESRNKNGATEEGAIFTPRSVRLYKGMLIASIEVGRLTSLEYYDQLFS